MPSGVSNYRVMDKVQITSLLTDVANKGLVILYHFKKKLHTISHSIEPLPFEVQNDQTMLNDITLKFNCLTHWFALYVMT